jgi:hypothetical protein
MVRFKALDPSVAFIPLGQDGTSMIFNSQITNRIPLLIHAIRVLQNSLLLPRNYQANL